MLAIGGGIFTRVLLWFFLLWKRINISPPDFHSQHTIGSFFPRCYFRVAHVEQQPPEHSFSINAAEVIFLCISMFNISSLQKSKLTHPHIIFHLKVDFPLKSDWLSLFPLNLCFLLIFFTEFKEESCFCFWIWWRKKKYFFWTWVGVWMYSLNLFPVTHKRWGYLNRHGDKKCEKGMKLSCTQEGQINIYPFHLHSSDDKRQIVLVWFRHREWESQREVHQNRRIAVGFNAALKSNIKIECDLFTCSSYKACLVLLLPWKPPSWNMVITSELNWQTVHHSQGPCRGMERGNLGKNKTIWNSKNQNRWRWGKKDTFKEVDKIKSAICHKHNCSIDPRISFNERSKI